MYKYNNMKKLVASLVLSAIVISFQGGYAQASYCKGLKNPTSFVIQAAGNSANAVWYGFTGSKNAVASQCGNWGMTGWGTQINAAQLASQSSGSSCTNSSSVDRSGQSDTQKRFVIKGSGTDPLTSGRLSYLPPDPSFTSSIRLGNNCGGTHEAEMLCYQFDVRTQNSLVFIWYALSLQNGQHSIPQNPEFAIEIEKKVGNNWVRIGGDTLCYVRPTPAEPGTDVAPFYRGATGTQTGGTYGENLYLPWNKVAINLNKYLYETVRIRIGAGDCSMSAHYACAYIAGECQSMEIATSGCPAGATSTVQTLTAPVGLTNYVWYKCNSGTEGITSLFNVPSTIHFTQLTPSTSTNNVYNCVIEDFRLTEGAHAGEYTNEQVFRCDMTSKMNETIPFVSKVYVRVQNTKPLAALDSLHSCDGDLYLTDKSYVPGDMRGVDTSLTEWFFHSGSTDATPVVATRVGGKAQYQYTDDPGVKAVRVRTHTPTDTACYTDKTYAIKVLGRPTPVIHATDHELCDAEVVTLTDRTQGSVYREWRFADETIVGNSPTDNVTHARSFDNYSNPVELYVRNGLFTHDSVNTYDTIWCSNSAYDTIHVFQHPELVVSGDTVVCMGDKTNATISTETDGCTYRWYRHLNQPGESAFASGATLRTEPYANVSKYYVKVTSPQGCVAWDSVFAYLVVPTLERLPYTGEICSGDTVTLMATSADHYSWRAEPEDKSLLAQLDSLGHGASTIKVVPQESTVYTLIGHGTNDCSASPLTTGVTVYYFPKATVSMSPNFVDSENPVVTFTDVSKGHYYTAWDFHNGDVATGSTYSYNFGEILADDSVEVTLMSANQLGCADTLDFKVPTRLYTYYAPNIFTPDRPENAKWRLFSRNMTGENSINQRLEYFHVYVYDRDGRLVFSSETDDFEWDGYTTDGLKCPKGTYVYVATYRRPGTEDVVTQKGTVTLLR